MEGTTRVAGPPGWLRPGQDVGMEHQHFPIGPRHRKTDDLGWGAVRALPSPPLPSQLISFKALPRPVGSAHISSTSVSPKDSMGMTLPLACPQGDRGRAPSVSVRFALRQRHEARLTSRRPPADSLFRGKSNDDVCVGLELCSGRPVPGRLSLPVVGACRSCQRSRESRARPVHGLGASLATLQAHLARVA